MGRMAKYERTTQTGPRAILTRSFAGAQELRKHKALDNYTILVFMSKILLTSPCFWLIVCKSSYFDLLLLTMGLIIPSVNFIRGLTLTGGCTGKASCSSASAGLYSYKASCRPVLSTNFASFQIFFPWFYFYWARRSRPLSLAVAP